MKNICFSQKNMPKIRLFLKYLATFVAQKYKLTFEGLKK